MKKIIYIIFPLIVYAFAYAGVAHAASCPASPADETACEVVEGCVYSSVAGEPVCNECPEDFYYDSTTDPNTGAITAASCKPCPNSHPKSAAGTTTGKAACYKTCETINITGGKKLPNADKAYYNNDCSYTIQCDTTGNETCSKLGYHLNTAGNACVSDVSSCGNGGLRFYGDNTCYYNTCGSSYTLNPKKQCNSDVNEYGTCELNLISCSSRLSASLCKNETNDANGRIEGNASLVVPGFSYNYENCTCTKQASIENGTGTKKCYFNSSGTAAATNCQTTLATCNIGYCNTSGLQCATVPAGQYSIGTSKECLSCTPGATSAAGSRSRSACHYTNQTTFKDTAGTFTLPDDDDNIKIEWSW
jgi:hypothetical protein